MDIRNNTSLTTIDNTAIVQLASLSPNNNDFFSGISEFEGEAVTELTEANYCPLPEYCLIEEKYKYVAG